eukprot:1274946-Amphidinium_carterae.1
MTRRDNAAVCSGFWLRFASELQPWSCAKAEPVVAQGADTLTCFHYYPGLGLDSAGQQNSLPYDPRALFKFVSKYVVVGSFDSMTWNKCTS